MEILWYDSRKQLKDEGRFRFQRSLNEAILEIFDCDAGDTGRSSTVATSGNLVASYFLGFGEERFSKR